jgi:hypothetical protein
MQMSTSTILAFRTGFALACTVREHLGNSIYKLHERSLGSRVPWGVVLDGEPFYLCTIPTHTSSFPFLSPLTNRPTQPADSTDSTESISWVSSPSPNISLSCHLETIHRCYTVVEPGLNYFALGPPRVITSITARIPTSI